MQLATPAAAALSALLVVAGCSTEQPVTSQDQACEIVKRAAVEFCLSRTNLSGRYYCETMPEYPEHYRLGLRYEVNPDELVGSNLIGWFAVRRTDGVVLEEDIAGDRLVPLASGCPFETE
jgi:hypothetical protein